MEKILFGVKIKEKGNFLSLSDLQKAYDEGRKMYGWSTRKISSVSYTEMFLSSTYEILNYKNIIISEIETKDVFLQKVNEIGISSVLKSYGVYKTTGARHTKQTYCIDWLWRIYYSGLFDSSTLVTTPKFILDIEYIDTISKQSFIKRRQSREENFINRFLASSNLITDKFEKQHRIGKYIYDLRIEMLGKVFLIEYHESGHRNKDTLSNDLEKYNQVSKYDDLALIVIPYDKEEEQLNFIKECLKNNYSASDINDIEFFRHKSLLDKLKNDYAMEINKKVFGVHKNGIRNLASAKELRKIADIEKFVIQAINVGLVKDNQDILKVITSFN